MNGRVVGMESSSCVATVRREFKPHRRSRGEINRTRRVLTTHSCDLCTWTWRPVIYLQHIITSFRVKLKELHFDAVATGYCNTPGASLVVWIIVGVLRTCKASIETPMRMLDGCVVGMEPSPRGQIIRREFKPHGCARGEINSIWGILTTDRGDLSTWIWRAVINLQRIITSFGVELIKDQFDEVSAWHCYTPGACLARYIISGIIRTCNAPWETPVLGDWTHCRKTLVIDWQPDQMKVYNLAFSSGFERDIWMYSLLLEFHAGYSRTFFSL